MKHVLPLLGLLHGQRPTGAKVYSVLAPKQSIKNGPNHGVVTIPLTYDRAMANVRYFIVKRYGASGRTMTERES